MKKYNPVLIAVILFLGNCTPKADSPSAQETASEEKPLIFFVNSYHEDFPWVQGVMAGFYRELSIQPSPDGSLDQSESPYELRVFYMDTKRNNSQEYIRQSAVRANGEIQVNDPDIIITCDDNAAAYLIKPYYADKEIPVVFCGVNWDASEYDFPPSQITGIVEVILIRQLVDQLSNYSAKEGRIGLITEDSPSYRKVEQHFERELEEEVKTYFASSYGDWLENFITLQNEVDLLLVGYPGALAGWDGDEARLKQFIYDNTRIPTGAWDEWLSDKVLVTYAQEAEEQGEWAARTAKRILNGASPGEIPVSRNVNSIVYLNMSLARKMEIRFPHDLLERAHLEE